MTARLCGSGVVCYAMRDGEVWLLLGRERDTPGWHQGSRRWSTFSGRAEGGESALQNATREFLEESCGAVQLEPEGAVPVDAASVERCLAKSGVLERRFQAKNEIAKHVTFVARVPLLDQVSVFAFYRFQLLRLDAIFKALHRARKSCDAVPRLALPGFKASPLLATRDFDVFDAPGARLLVELWDGRRGHVVELDATEEMLVELRRLRDAQAVVRAFLAEHAGDPLLRHPAVRVARVGGVVAHAHVDRAFLEKSELRWFAARELLEAQAEGLLDDSFRRCFVESLHDITACIDEVELRGGDGEGVRRLSFDVGAKSALGLSTLSRPPG